MTSVAKSLDSVPCRPRRRGNGGREVLDRLAVRVVRHDRHVDDTHARAKGRLLRRREAAPAPRSKRRRSAAPGSQSQRANYRCHERPSVCPQRNHRIDARRPHAGHAVAINDTMTSRTVPAGERRRIGGRRAVQEAAHREAHRYSAREPSGQAQYQPGRTAAPRSPTTAAAEAPSASACRIQACAATPRTTPTPNSRRRQQQRDDREPPSVAIIT